MAINEKGIYRVIDANANRAREGLRVCEDICRFILDKRTETRKIKDIRHALTEQIRSLNSLKMLACRDIEKDVGKQSILTELKRKEIQDVFYANSQRVKESLRVLEEFAKLIDEKAALEFKSMRYKIYAVEKNTIKEF